MKTTSARSAVKATVSFSKLFRAKRDLEKAEASKDQAAHAFTQLLRQSAHLSGRIATYNKNRYYVTITSDDPWRRPSLKLQKVHK